MTMSNNNNNNNDVVVINGNNGQFGDTTLTKVFVGGLAWETPKEAMREHFEKYGGILEAVIISDKVTGRSKGYGFVTFKDPEAAKKACEDATPVINGRRANCNLASLGARRPRSSSATAAATTTPAAIVPPLSHQGSNGVGPRTMPSTATNQQVQWYYPTGTPAALPYHHHHHHHHQAIPLFGYSPPYIAADISYNHKLSYNCGTYMNGHYSQVYPSQAMLGANTLMPMYHPLYPYQQHHHHHQSHATMGLPAHTFPVTTSGPINTVPAILSKPASTPPPPPPPNSGSIGAGEKL